MLFFPFYKWGNQSSEGQVMAQDHPASELDSDTSMLDSSLSFAVPAVFPWILKALVCLMFGANSGVQSSAMFSPSFFFNSAYSCWISQTLSKEDSVPTQFLLGTAGSFRFIKWLPLETRSGKLPDVLADAVSTYSYTEIFFVSCKRMKENFEIFQFNS